jgi:hypothetical protein
MIEITTLQKLRGFYPSQWEGRTSEGGTVRIRYKHGELTVWLQPHGGGPEIISFSGEAGEKHGFAMDTEEMKACLTNNFRFVD